MSSWGTGDHNNDKQADGYYYRSSDSDGDDDDIQYPQMNSDLSMPGSVKEMINVLVTGFGPFDEHKTNASWEAVKELKKLGVAHNVNLIIVQMPVCYEEVKTVVPMLWERHKPSLTVHVGVSSQASELTFETLAHNEGYKRLDITGQTAASQCCRKDGVDCLKPGLNIEQVCKDVNEGSCLAMSVLSTNAGRYLCEFIFYASLAIDSSRVAFIHVPMLNNPYTAAEIGHGLQVAIQSMLKLLHLYHPLPLPDDQSLNYANDQFH